MTQLTTNGFTRTRLDEREEQLKASAQAIFGNDADLGSDTMDGQHVGLFAERIADLDELAETVWNSFDPDGATGQSLSRLVKLNGIERNEGAYSLVTLTLTGTPNTPIAARSVVSNAQGTVLVYTTEEVTLDGTGNATVLASPEKMGTIEAGANTLTVIRSPSFGWDTVTNNSPMIAGKVRETDEQLRIRRRQSVSIANNNVVDGLWSALMELDNVLEVSVLENVSDSVDSNGLPPHSIHCVVLGGNDADIAKIIWQRKTAGCTIDGQTSVTVQDIQGHDQVVKFTRPTLVPIDVYLNISQRLGYHSNTNNQIKSALVSWFAENISNGEEVRLFNLYAPINTVGGFVVNDLQIARHGQPLIEQNLAMAFYERATLDIGNINIVVV